MNLPNKLTIARVVLIPFFVAALLYDGGGSKTMRIVADILFILASLTDLLDGKLARRYNLVTNFGKFMDPLADKLLVCSALICLVELGQAPAWMVIVIISREFIISGFRLGKIQNHLSDDCGGAFDCEFSSIEPGGRYYPLGSPGADSHFIGRLHRKKL